MLKVGIAWRDGQKMGPVLLVRLGTAWVTLGTAIAFLRMQLAAWEEAGVQFVLNSGWRSWDEQKALHLDFLAGKRKAVVDPPGESNHQDGRALDIESGNGSNAAFKWLTANAARFGFKRTVKSEPWHWEYRPEVNA